MHFSILAIWLCLIVVPNVVLGDDIGAHVVNEVPEPWNDGARITSLLSDHKKELSEFMKSELHLSLKNLYKSTVYSSQFLERPGLSKLLLELSDNRWEEAVATIRKFLQRGGSTESLNLQELMKFKIEKPQSEDLIASKLINKSPAEKAQVMGDDYVVTLRHLLSESKEQAKKLNNLHRLSMKLKTSTNEIPHDAEMGHYFAEKMESEVTRTRSLSNHVVNLNKMASTGLALHYFDNSL